MLRYIQVKPLEVEDAAWAEAEAVVWVAVAEWAVAWVKSQRDRTLGTEGPIRKENCHETILHKATNCAFLKMIGAPA